MEWEGRVEREGEERKGSRSVRNWRDRTCPHDEVLDTPFADSCRSAELCCLICGGLYDVELVVRFTALRCSDATDVEM